MPPEATQLDDHELELHSTDRANFPYIKIRGNLYWDGTAWVKWDGTSGLSLPKYDYIGVGYPDGDTEVYTFNTGGVGGTTVATLTVNYTDATKEFISNVAKT